MSRPLDTKKLQAIHRASLKLILKEGFGGFKMNLVAEEAKVATGTVYIYFENKEALIRQLYLLVKSQFSKSLLSGHDPDEAFMNAFRRLWRNYVQYSFQRPAEKAFVEQYYRSQYFTKQVNDQRNILLSPVFELLDRGKSQGLVAPIPTGLLVAQLTGAMDEIGKWHLDGRLNLDERGFDYAYKMAWNSVRR